MSTHWQRLIRFEDTKGNIHYGDAVLPKDCNDAGKAASEGTLQARVLQLPQGHPLDSLIMSHDCQIDNSEVKVAKLLAPLAKEDVPIIRCIGLNYIKHIQEAGRAPPPFPSLFIKPSASVADWGEDIPIPKIAQKTCDYEGELVVVIGKTVTNVSRENALEYIAGYTVGNDVSCRHWQSDPKYAGGAPQWNFSKGFDKYAPIGPVLVSPRVINDPGKLVLQTRVNGILRQDGNTDDLLFDVAYLVSFLSQGTTLETGTLIFTGTPSGVGMGMVPSVWLRDGDEVEVFIDGIGTLRNKMVFI